MSAGQDYGLHTVATGVLITRNLIVRNIDATNPTYARIWLHAAAPSNAANIFSPVVRGNVIATSGASLNTTYDFEGYAIQGDQITPSLKNGIRGAVLDENQSFAVLTTYVLDRGALADDEPWSSADARLRHQRRR